MNIASKESGNHGERTTKKQNIISSNRAFDVIEGYEKGIVVIGGGIAGIQASLDLAKAGIKVYLVEKSESIGGMMSRLSEIFPSMDCAT